MVAGMVLRLGIALALLHAAGRRSAEASQLARERFERLTEHSHQGVAVIRGEQMLYANPALLRIYGLASLQEVRTLWREATMPEAERAAGRERHRRLVAGESEREDWSGLRFRFDGTPIRLRFSAWRVDWDGGAAEQVIVTDETVQHDATAALLHQATHDELTGLPTAARCWRAARAVRRRRRLRAAAARRRPLQALQRGARPFARRRGAARAGGAAGRRAARRGRDHAPGRGRVRAARAGRRPERAAHALAQQVRELLAQPLACRAGVLPRRVDGRLAAPGPWPRRRGAAARRQRRDARGQERAGHLAAVRRGALRARLGRHAAGRAGLARRPARRAVQPRLPAQGRGAQRARGRRCWSASRRWCAGIIRSAAACRRSNSCPPPSAPAWSARSARSSSSGLRAAGALACRLRPRVPVAVNVSPLQLLDPASSTRCWRSWPATACRPAAVAGDHRASRSRTWSRRAAASRASARTASTWRWTISAPASRRSTCCAACRCAR